eukprot:10278403-Lingulodinium_polyedra.AAC.1
MATTNGSRLAKHRKRKAKAAAQSTAKVHRQRSACGDRRNLERAEVGKHSRLDEHHECAIARDGDAVGDD